MRKTYNQILKHHLYKYLRTNRADMRLTMAQMAELLEMAPRSYACLEHGRSGCSAVTLVLLVKCCCQNQNLLDELYEAFMAAARNAQQQ